jgi:FkbM family methyltransferase
MASLGDLLRAPPLVRAGGGLRRVAARLVWGSGARPIELFGTPLVVDPRRELGYLLAAQQQRLGNTLRNDLPVLLSLAGIIGPGDTFVDAGANVGLYSATLARLRHVLPGLALHAFEVNPETARRLRASVAGLGVVVHEHGLSDRAGVIRFAPGATSGLFGAADGAAADAVELPVRRFDDCAVPGDSVVMKVDVEGHEHEVLQGAAAAFAAGRVKAVYVDGYRDPRIPALLAAHGLGLFDGRTLRPVAGPAPQTLLALRTG